jgi:peptidoglycan-associated lipoprotein
MSRRTVCCLIVAVALTSLAAGCKRKPPVTPARAPEVSTGRVAPAAPPAAAAEAEPDAVEQDLWSQDLEAVNRHALERGLLADVYFDFDRSELRDDAREQLARNSQFIRQHPEFLITIEGHCDERGTSEYNLALGESRASAARSYVANLAASGARLQTVSYGKERPQCSESHEGCWQKNRRAGFVITGRLSP